MVSASLVPPSEVSCPAGLPLSWVGRPGRAGRQAGVKGGSGRPTAPAAEACERSIVSALLRVTPILIWPLGGAGCLLVTVRVRGQTVLPFYPIRPCHSEPAGRGNSTPQGIEFPRPAGFLALRGSSPFGVSRPAGFLALRGSSPCGVPRPSSFLALRGSSPCGVPRPSGFLALRARNDRGF